MDNFNYNPNTDVKTASVIDRKNTDKDIMSLFFLSGAQTVNAMSKVK